MPRISISRLTSFAALGGSLALLATSVVFASAPQEKGAPAVEREDGIPVTDARVVEKCGTCHAPDDKGNLTRISWVRTTPEGWAQVIKRMVRLNGLDISPADSRAIVQSLSASHGLAPEEAHAVNYIPEKRMLDEMNIPDEAVRGACASCHAFGQALSWRRSGSEWKLLQDMHVALYSQADAQYRRVEGGSGRGGAGPADADAPPKKNRGEIALAYMRKTAPLHTPEWAAWSARARAPRLAGDWLVVASVPGKGRFVGSMQIAPGDDGQAFRTQATLRPLSGGPEMQRSGTGLVYAGYAWRGRSGGGSGTAPGALSSEAREAMWFSPDQQHAEGRWFWGEYHEFGYDVKLVRATDAPAILAVVSGAVKAGARDLEIRVVGHKLPANPAPGDVDLGTGLTIKRVVSSSATELVLNADVAEGAVSGPRDIALGGAVLEKAFAVYRKADFLKVTPETGLSRLGGARHPRGYQQFEALGYANGPDGKANTGDDIALGPIDVAWEIKEFPTVWYDDDVKFVGKLDQNGLFTPNVDGPNPARRFGRNNYGEVWVTATAKSEKDAFGKPLSARAFLVVTVPAYQRWDQPEVSK